MFLKSKATARKEDNPNWWKVISGTFADEYWKSAFTDINTLEKMSAWVVINRTYNMNSIYYTWTFKLKRFPDGMINKFKACFCDRVYQQLEGIDFFKDYTPVFQMEYHTFNAYFRSVIVIEVKISQYRC